MAMPRTLDQWLEYQLATHPQAIAMGLDRVRAVAGRLVLQRPGRHVIVVGGTNGKGSTVAFIDSIARAAGLNVGTFTSPHLLRYNERVRINGIEVADQVLVEAFTRIERARAEIPITYFEFGTLAALLVFADADLDLAVLEVGLGGRLDAVNIIDADVAVLTTVALDHQAYLGNDRETIGADKAGIFRAGRPCVLGEKDPPSSVLRHAYAIGAQAIRAHADYLVERKKSRWTWREPGFEISLPMPLLDAPVQLDNAAAAIAALRALPLDIGAAAMSAGVSSARLAGRLQVVAIEPELLLDVAHNTQAAAELARWLQSHPKPTRAVFSALRDKDVEAIVTVLAPAILAWYVTGISDAGERGMDAASLAARVRAVVPTDRVRVHDSAGEAISAARADSTPDERVLVFGSFHTVAAAMRAAAATT